MRASGNNKTNAENKLESPLFDQRLENALGDLEPYFMNHLKNRISKVNTLAIIDYILSMKVETNLSANHRRGIITSLNLVWGNKPFKTMSREDILGFLDSIRKPDTVDPLHRWIGTYNHRLMDLLGFFKWLYSPHIEPSKRRKPDVVANIPTLKRK